MSFRPQPSGPTARTFLRDPVGVELDGHLLRVGTGRSGDPTGGSGGTARDA
ncbi:hypothetical protein ABZX30_25545 [Streptomyces sp. NPDC004542]|uniref:hypothetical protein n=1 Tax=Streptomyces sp. NPDC004542 TaxID=3154281 RepID=UPI0033AB22CC